MTKNSVHETQLATNINEKAKTYSDTENRILIRNGHIVGLLTKSSAHKKLQSCFNIWLEGKNSADELSYNIVCDNFITPLLEEGHSFFQSRVDNQGNEHFDPCDTFYEKNMEILFQVLTCYIKKSKKSSSRDRKLKADSFDKSENLCTRNEKDKKSTAPAIRTESICAQPMENDVFIKNGNRDILTDLVNSESLEVYDSKVKGEKFKHVERIVKEKLQGEGYRNLLENDEAMVTLVKKVQQKFRDFRKLEIAKKQSKNSDHQEDDIDHEISSSNLSPRILPGTSTVTQKITLEHGCGPEITPAGHTKGHYYENTSSKRSASSEIQARPAKKPCNVSKGCMEPLPFTIEQQLHLEDFLRYSLDLPNRSNSKEGGEFDEQNTSLLLGEQCPNMLMNGESPHPPEGCIQLMADDAETSVNEATRNKGCMEPLPFTIQPQDIAYLFN